MAGRFATRGREYGSLNPEALLPQSMIQVIFAFAVVLVAPAALSFTSPTPTQKSRLGLRFNDGDKDEFRD